MELKTNYQYTYFIYPFVIKEEKYKRYIANLIKNKKFKTKFFDAFKDIDLYKYFVPSVKEKIFQDFSFNIEKINKFEKLSKKYKTKILQKENCLIFEYLLEDQIQGKIEEKDGIFFNIAKIELVCFKTGICFLLLKTHLLETNSFEDILNFNYKFENINFEAKSIKKLDNIKIQTDRFDNISGIAKVIEEITGQKLESKEIDIDENLFLVYTYACLESNYWKKESDFENIENEFIKLAQVKPSNAIINVDYDKLSMLSNASYMKVRASSKCVALICSATDAENYTKLPQSFENEYLYTYIIALHQKYYLNKLNNEFERKTKITLNRFIKFTNNIWISEITSDSFGQKLYKRFKEKLNSQDTFNKIKNKYDIYYKKLNIDKNRNINNIIFTLLASCLVIGIANFVSWIFFK